MNDGSITFSTALDNKELERQLRAANKKIAALSQKISRDQKKKIPLVKQSEKLSTQLDIAKAKLEEMKNAQKGAFSKDDISAQKETVAALQSEWDSVQKQVEGYERAIKKATAQLSGQEETAGSLERELAKDQTFPENVDGTAVERADEKIGALMGKMRTSLAQASQVAMQVLAAPVQAFQGMVSGVVKTVGSVLKKLSSITVNVAKRLNVFSKLADSISGKFKRLGNTIKSALVFSVIYKGLGMVKEQIGTYLSLNSNFTAALSRVKGALLTAFQPIYDFVVPALTALLNILSRAISAISQFTASLFGTTAKQAQANASALYDQAKATDAAGGAAKDAEKSLAGFDEINKLSGSKDGGGSGGGTASSTPAFDAELDDTAFTSWGESFSAFLDNFLNNGIPRLEQGISAFSGRVNDLSANLLEMFTFPGVLDKVNLLGKNLATAFNGMTRSINWNQFGAAIGAGLNTALAFAVSFLYTFDWISLGTSLASLVNGLIAQIDWYNVGALLFAGFKIGIETLAGFILGIDMTQMALAASNLVMGFMDSVAETLQTVDWEGIGHQVKEFLINVNWAGVAESTFTAIGAAFGALTEFLWGLIKDAWKEVVDWWYDVAYEDGKFTLEGLLKGIVDVVKNIGAWIKEHIFQPFIDGFKSVFGINSPSTVMAEMGHYLMDGLLGGINENSDSILGSFKTILGGVLDFITGVFTGDWGKAWDGIKDVFKGAWNGIVVFLEGAVNIIIKGLNWLIEQMNKISFDVPDWVPGIGGKTLGVNIPLINEVEIPRLATGAVIPPNREFMAVLGDQKSGTNIEAPLDTIVQAVMLALSKSGYSGGNGENVAYLYVGDDQFGKLVYKANRRESNRIGVTLVEGSV